MKKRKLVIIISSIICLALMASVVAITFSKPKHKHSLGEAKTYHISNQGVYYTRQCCDEYVKSFNTGVSFLDVMMTTSSSDKIVLDEDLTITETITINSAASGESGPVPLNLNINLDLNGHQINTDAAPGNGSMFDLRANYGKISLNIKNGKLFTDDLSYIFSFKNNTTANNNQNIVLNIDNVECVVKGANATPLFANNTAVGISVSATDSKFIVQNAEGASQNTGVGAFINCDGGNFAFTNCDFEAGDGIYVKQGKVDLVGCNLKSVLSKRIYQETANPFYAIGAALLAESYNSGTDCTLFDITINNCYMENKQSFTMIYIISTSAVGGEAAFNDDSCINVESGRFGANPATATYGYKNSLDEDVVKYNSEPKAVIEEMVYIVE